jgi:hypothetical protein
LNTDNDIDRLIRANLDAHRAHMLSLTDPLDREEAWSVYEESRGPLAGTPEFLVCYECSRAAGIPPDPLDLDGYIEHAVVRLGPIAEPHRDPTQTYVLSCGHTVI